jgi:hypothetical protein
VLFMSCFVTDTCSNLRKKNKEKGTYLRYTFYRHGCKI